MAKIITAKKIRFDKSGYYFIGLLALAFLGFWNSYFSKFFNGINDYNRYFHFHAVMMIGKASYFIMPLLLVWYRHNVQIHARAMIISGIVFIEPALFRLLGGVVFKGMGAMGFYVGVTLILSY